MITNKRAVESTVLVDDGQIIVIGGLIQDSVRMAMKKFPVLGDLPLLGGLFRYSTRSRTKTNLMVFLRPTVMRTAQGADAITTDRYDYILGEQLKATPRAQLFRQLDHPPCRRVRARRRQRPARPRQDGSPRPRPAGLRLTVTIRVEPPFTQAQ